MLTLAITFTTNYIDYVVLAGNRKEPILQVKRRMVLPVNYDIPKTVTWFETELDLLLNTIKPNIVSYKLTINNVTNSYVSAVYYWQGILNLLCSKKDIKICHTSPASLKPSKFDQPKDTKLHEYIESLIGEQKTPWDKGMKDTALIALLNL